MVNASAGVPARRDRLAEQSKTALQGPAHRRAARALLARRVGDRSIGRDYPVHDAPAPPGSAAADAGRQSPQRGRSTEYFRSAKYFRTGRSARCFRSATCFRSVQALLNSPRLLNGATTVFATAISRASRSAAFRSSGRPCRQPRSWRSRHPSPCPCSAASSACFRYCG